MSKVSLKAMCMCVARRPNARPLALSLLTLFAGVSAGQATGTDPFTAPYYADVPNMVEQGADAGIIHHYTGPWEYFVGGGAAAFDCNGDRYPDLLAAGGEGEAKLYVNRSHAGAPLKFEERAIGLEARDLKKVTGAYPIDIDADGWRDVVLLRVGGNIVLRGGPECSFAKAPREWNIPAGRDWTTAFAATFEPGLDGPTLAFGGYVDRSAAGSPWGTCHDNLLLRPDPRAKGSTIRYDAPYMLSPGYCALSMRFTDWNNTGHSDLRITNDRQYHLNGEEQLWRMEDGRPPRLYRKSEGWQHLNIWGMGIAEADLDADGRPEYALTSMGDTKLQKLDLDEEDRPTYRDIAYANGATAHRPYVGDNTHPSTGWHAEFADFNNDTMFDLFIAKGNVEAMPDFAAYDPDNLLMGRWDGTFSEQGDKAGIALDTRGRGAIVTDFDLDGDLDLFVINRDAPASLFQNRGAVVENASVEDRRKEGPPMGNWLQVELRQNGPNIDAVGARLSIRVGNRSIERTIHVGGGHASGHSGFVHVGLGVAERAQIRIKWPDGSWSHPYRVVANNFYVIDRDAVSAKLWLP